MTVFLQPRCLWTEV